MSWALSFFLTDPPAHSFPFLSKITLNALPGNQRVLTANRTQLGAMVSQTLVHYISHNAVGSLEGARRTTWWKTMACTSSLYMLKLCCIQYVLLFKMHHTLVDCLEKINSDPLVHTIRHLRSCSLTALRASRCQVGLQLAATCTTATVWPSYSAQSYFDVVQMWN